jgi:hypothetical protein
MQYLAQWLEQLGMSEYAQRFAENGIDVSALPHLTDQDLKDIGVLLGHRRRMLVAIGQVAGVAAATHEPLAKTKPTPQDAAERRQVAVMFSDLGAPLGQACDHERASPSPMAGAALTRCDTLS